MKRRIIDGDWLEDSHLENGNYTSLCARCGESFTGHKRRFVCKVCSRATKRSEKRRINPYYFLGALIGFTYVATIVVCAYFAW